jgi:RNA polymerase sigma factor (sigma-70 family)
LRRLLTGVLRDADRAGDAVQATFLKVLEQGHLVQKGAFKAWLFQVGMREALVLKRRQATRAQHADAVGRRNQGLSDAVHKSPVQAAEVREDVERMRAELARLPPEQRRVVELKIGEGLTYREIAESLGIPEGTVVTRVRLGMERLSKGLNAR